MSTFKIYFIVLATIVISILSTVNFCDAKKSDLSGIVLDNETEKPISDAYIIAFIEVLPWAQHFNIAGPNSKPHDIQITKTDNAGHFVLKKYNKPYKGSMQPREIFIYKRGYYALRFWQMKSYMTDSRYSHDQNKTSLIPLNKFVLSQDSNEINKVVSLVGSLEVYIRNFKYDAPDKYKQLKPFVTDIYKKLHEDSNQIKQSLKKEHIIHNWELSLNSLKSYAEEAP